MALPADITRSWVKPISLFSSVGVFLLEKVLSTLIIPIIAEWDWTTKQLLAVNLCAQIATDNCSLVYQSEFADRSQIKITSATEAPLLVNPTTKSTMQVSLHALDLIENNKTEAVSGQIDFQVALVFLAPPVTSIITSPIAGILGDTVGYDSPILASLVISVVISTLYAFSSSFISIFIVQILLGLLNACVVPNVLGRVFALCPYDSNQGNVMLGVLMACSSFDFFGPALYGVLYVTIGQIGTFLSLTPIEVLLLVCILSTFHYKGLIRRQEGIVNHDQEVIPLLQSKDTDHDNVRFSSVIKDYRIGIATITLSVAWLQKASLQPLLSIWMQNKFASNTATTGLVWGAAGVSDLAANFTSANFSKHHRQHICLYTAIHLALCTLPILALPTLPSPPTVALCLALNVYFATSARYGAVFILSSLSESEFQQSYGHVMGLANLGFTLPYIVAPLASIPLFNSVGFTIMCAIIGPISLLYTPLLYFLRNIVTEESYSSAAKKESYQVDLVPQEPPIIQTAPTLVQPEVQAIT